MKHHYKTLARGDADAAKDVYNSVPPNHVRGIVLHARIIRVHRRTMEASNTPGNYCFKCTILGPKGDPLEDHYTKALFDSNAIVQYLHRGVNSIVINQMTLESPDAFVPSPSQADQVGFGIHEVGAGFGYGETAGGRVSVPVEMAEWQVNDSNTNGYNGDGYNGDGYHETGEL
jgi:hypothetical protein